MYDRETGDEDRRDGDPTFDQIEARAGLLRLSWPDSRCTRMGEWSSGIEPPPQIFRRMVVWPTLCERQRLKYSEMEIDQ